MTRVGVYLTHALPMKDEIRYARLAEEKGFESVWQGQARYHRDSVVPLAAYAASTNRVKLGTGVLHALARNVVALAVEFNTLDEIAPGRAILGISALWDPMAHEIGIDVKKRLQAVEEYVVALRRLFNGDVVNFEGEFVKLRNVRLTRKTTRIPVYVGATGLKMIQLAGRVGEGVVLNYLISPEYTRQSVETLEAAAKEAGRDPSEIDRPQLIACSLDEDYDIAVSRLKPLLCEYLAKEPHIVKASGASEETVQEVRRIVKASRTESEGLAKAAHLVEDKLVERIAVVGNAEACQRKVKEYMAAGCTCPLLYSVDENVAGIIQAFSGF